MIEPTYDLSGVVRCGSCAARLTAIVGTEVGRGRTLLLWWSCDDCDEISRAFPIPARFLSADLANLGDVMRDGAQGLQPPGVAGAPAGPLRR